MQKEDYYLLVKGETQGPYTFDQLRPLWLEGKITVETCYWRPGMKEWQRISEIEHLIKPPTVFNPPQTGVRNEATQPEQKKKPGALGCAVIAGALGIVLLIGAIDFGTIDFFFESPGDAQKRESREAYETAKQFIKQNYPGAQKFAAYSDSIVQKDGSVYRVAIEVDGLNVFGGPVRNVVGVEMEYNGYHWNLITIKQQ